MPGPLFKVKSKKDFIRKLRRNYGYSASEARTVVDACYEGPGYYYHRGGDYFVRYSGSRDLARGGKVGRGRYKHTFDPIVEVAKRLAEETVRTAEAISRRVEEKIHKPVKPEVLVKAAFPRRPRIQREVKRLADYVWEELSPTVKREGKWTYIMVLNIIKMLHDYAKEQGIDIQQIDLIHKFDWMQGYYYVKGEILRRLMKTVEEQYAGLTDRDVEMMIEAWYQDMLERERQGYYKQYEEYIPDMPEPI